MIKVSGGMDGGVMLSLTYSMSYPQWQSPDLYSGTCFVQPMKYVDASQVKDTDLHVSLKRSGQSDGRSREFCHHKTCLAWKEHAPHAMWDNTSILDQERNISIMHAGQQSFTCFIIGSTNHVPEQKAEHCHHGLLEIATETCYTCMLNLKCPTPQLHSPN